MNNIQDAIIGAKKTWEAPALVEISKSEILGKLTNGADNNGSNNNGNS